MCGIVGAVSCDRNILPILITGLKNLEYRGYDSAGIAYLKNNKINIFKTSGKVSKLENKLNKSDYSNIGIAHTRWATHGKANNVNAHPHRVNHVTIVHNGIIENYEEIKEMLREENYSFKSSTDTEVACALLNYYLEKFNDIDKTIKAFISKVIGSYAILIFIDNDLDNLYVIKKESPLVIGVSNNINIISSDIRAILKYTNKYYILDDFEYAKVSSNEVIIKNSNGDVLNKELHTINIKDNSLPEILEEFLKTKQKIN